MYEEIMEDVEEEIERQLELIDDASLGESLEEVVDDTQIDARSNETLEEVSDDWAAALDVHFVEFYSRIDSELEATPGTDAAAVSVPASALPANLLAELEAEEVAEDKAAAASSYPDGAVPPLDLAGATSEAAAEGLRSGRSSIMTVRQLESTNPDKRIIEAWMETEEELIQLKTERWRLYSDLAKASPRRRRHDDDVAPPLERQLSRPQEVDEDAARKQLAEEERRHMQSFETLLVEERLRTQELRQLSDSVTAKRLHDAAVAIQRVFRGFRIRNRIGGDIQRQLERARRKLFNEKVVRLEKERQRMKALEHHRRRQDGESRLASSRASSRSSSSLSGSTAVADASRPSPPPPLAEVPEAAEEAAVAEVPPSSPDVSGHRTASTYVLPDQRFPPLTVVRDPNYSPGVLIGTQPAKQAEKKQKQQSSAADPKEVGSSNPARPILQKRPTSARAISRNPPSPLRAPTAAASSSEAATASQADDSSTGAAQPSLTEVGGAVKLETQKEPTQQLDNGPNATPPIVTEIETSESNPSVAEAGASTKPTLTQVSEAQEESMVDSATKKFSIESLLEASASGASELTATETEPRKTPDSAPQVPQDSAKPILWPIKQKPEPKVSHPGSKKATSKQSKPAASVPDDQMKPEGAKSSSKVEVPILMHLPSTAASETASEASKTAPESDKPEPGSSSQVSELPKPIAQTIQPEVGNEISLSERALLAPESTVSASEIASAAAEPAQLTPESPESALKADKCIAESISTTEPVLKSSVPASESAKPTSGRPIRPTSARGKSDVGANESAELAHAAGGVESARERTTDHINDLGQDLFIARLGWVKSQPTYAAVMSAAAAATPSPKRRPRRQAHAASAGAEEATVETVEAERRILTYTESTDGTGAANDLAKAASLCLERLQPPIPPVTIVGAVIRCVALCALRIADCGLTSLPALAAGCPQLQLLDVSSNALQQIDVSGLDQLFHLNAGRNRLTALYGMETAKRLVHLDVSENRLTKLDFSALLPRLLHLNASRNQLSEVSPAALHLFPSVVWLDLAGNHIAAFDSASGLPCLAVLDVSGNDLAQFPNLNNSPLLTRLNVSENSLTSLPAGGCGGPLWLPCLRDCSLGGNQLACPAGQLAAFLRRCPLLRRLDLSANCLTCLSESDLTQVGAACPAVELLDLAKNPGATAAIRRLAAAARLSNIFDGRRLLSDDPAADAATLRLEEATPPSSHFLRKCLEFSAHLSGKEAHFSSQVHLSPAPSLLALLRYSRRFYCDCFQAVKRLRCYQEFEHYLDVRKADLLLYDGLEASLGVEKTATAAPAAALAGPPPADKSAVADERRRQAAAVKIQAAFRGHAFRRRIDDSLTMLERAAVRIQSTWRGHQVRQWIRAALATVKTEEDDDEANLDGGDMDEDEINIDELDVDAMFDNIQLPNSPRPVSARLRTLPPKDAWINSPNSGRFTPLDRLDLKGSLQVNTHRSDSTTGAPEPQPGRGISESTHRSKKVDQIKDDWGFHDERSAQVMLERAKKMKLNSDKRKRLSKLDPQQRYILFKKLEASARPVMSTRPAESKAQMHKVEYFKAKELERIHAERSKAPDDTGQHREERTFEWVFNSPVNESAGVTRRPKSHESTSGVGGPGHHHAAAGAAAAAGRESGFLPHIHSGRSNSVVSQSSLGDRAALLSAGTPAHAPLAPGVDRVTTHQLPPIKRRR